MASKTLSTVLSLQDNASSKLTKLSSNFANLSSKAKSSLSAAQGAFDKLKDHMQETGALDKLKDHIQKTVTKASDSCLKMTTSLGKSGLQTGLSKALDLEEYKAQLEVATQSTEKASEVMQYSINMASKTPFESGQMIEASSKLESMGLSAQDYLSSVADMAAGSNAPLEDATDAFIAAQSGQLDALSDFGVEKADIQAKANEMFAGQQVINNDGQIANEENYNKVLMAIMEERYGGNAEKFSKTTKGMLKSITDITQNSLAQIVGIGEDGVIKSGSLLDAIREKLMMVMDKLAEWKDNGTLDSIANTATEVFKKIFSVVSTFVNFVIEHPDIAAAILGIGSAFAIVGKVGNTLSGAFDSIKSSFDMVSTVGKTLSGVFGSIKSVWGSLSKLMLASPTGLIIIGIVALVAGLFLLWQKCEGFRNLVTSIGQTIMTWFQGTIMPILQSIFFGLQNLWNTVLLPFGIWLISTLGPIFTTVFSAIWNVVSQVFANIGIIIEGALLVFSGIIDFITGIFTGNWALAWEGVTEIFGGIFDTLIDLAKGPINFVIGLINSVIAGINSLSFTVPKGFPGEGTTFGVHIEEIPLLATGSHYTKSGLTLVGEHGPELVNMPGGARVNTNSETNRLLSGRNTGPIQIYVDTFIGEESFADKCGEIVGRKVLSALNNM